MLLFDSLQKVGKVIKINSPKAIYVPETYNFGINLRIIHCWGASRTGYPTNFTIITPLKSQNALNRRT